MATTRRRATTRLGSRAAASATRRTGAKKGIKSDAELLKLKHMQLLKKSGIKASTPKAIELPPDGNNFAVEVRATTDGYALQTRALEGAKIGIPKDKSTLTLGVKLGSDRTAEIIGLDSILIRGTQAFVNKLNLVAASNHGRCNLGAAVKVGSVVNPGPDGDPFARTVNPSQLIRF
jgi:hypothetical protein